MILKNPNVDNLASFIGVDGINTTPNSGRIQINLKPRDQRKETASQIIRDLQPELAKVEGITLYMQPVQDLTVESRVSRTQYQYSMEDADASELAVWAPKLLVRLQSVPALRDVASDQQNNGLQANLVIDRDTASRLGIVPQAIDDTLYDAFGQRQVSTMFTQLNQYHVVLEADPQFQTSPDVLKNIYVKSSTGASNAGSDPSAHRATGTPGSGAPATVRPRQRASSAFRILPVRAAQCPAGDQSPGPVSGRQPVIQPGSGCFPGRGHPGD